LHLGQTVVELVSKNLLDSEEREVFLMNSRQTVVHRDLSLTDQVGSGDQFIPN
jgi:hypothetical protein